MSPTRRNWTLRRADARRNVKRRGSLEAPKLISVERAKMPLPLAHAKT